MINKQSHRRVKSGGGYLLRTKLNHLGNDIVQVALWVQPGRENLLFQRQVFSKLVSRLNPALFVSQ